MLAFTFFNSQAVKRAIMGGCCCSGGKNKKQRLGKKSTYAGAAQSEAQTALNELLETEETFGLDMRFLVEGYMDPLRSEAIFFDNTELMLLNNIVIDLTRIQSKFQKRLESYTERLGEEFETDLSDIIYNVADAFIAAVRDFDIFAKYVVAMSRVQKVLGNSGQNEKIIKFIEKKQQEIKVQGDQPNAEHFLKNEKILTMESLLLKPFQRVMLYPLILERLQKQAEDGTSDKEHIGDAIEMTKRIAAKMNDNLKKDEETGEVYKALLILYSIQEYKK